MAASLTVQVRTFVRRHQFALLAKASVLALLGGGTLCALGWRMHGAELAPSWLNPVLLAVAGVGALGLGWWVRRRWLSSTAAVRTLDDALHLEQRLVTAAEFEKAPHVPALYPRLLDDTMHRFSTSKQHVPRPLDRTTFVLAMVLLMLLVWPIARMGPLQLGRTDGVPPPQAQPDEVPPPETDTQDEQPEDSQSGESQQDQQQSGQDQQQKGQQDPQEGQQDSQQGGQDQQESPSESDGRPKDGEGSADPSASQPPESREQGHDPQGESSQEQQDTGERADSSQQRSEPSSSQGQDDSRQGQDPQPQDREQADQQAQESSGDGRQEDSGARQSQQQQAQEGDQASGEGEAQQDAEAQEGAGQGQQQAQAAGLASAGGGTEQSSGSQEALKADIQELLKEMQGELQQIQEQLAAEATEEPYPQAGTGTDSNLFGEPEEIQPSTGPELRVQLRTDDAETSSRRPGGGVGDPSAEISDVSPQATPGSAVLSDQPLEETSNRRRVVPPEYQPVFENLYQRTSEPEQTAAQ